MKRTLALILALLLVGLAMLLSACTSPLARKNEDLFPGNRPGTTWRTADGRIEFTVIDTPIPEHEVGRGHTTAAYHWNHGEGTYITADQEMVKVIYVDSVVEGNCGIYPEATPSESFERWTAVFFQEDAVVFKVLSSALYQEGERVVLHRVEPCGDPGSSWRSEDGRLAFTVEELIVPEREIKVSWEKNYVAVLEPYSRLSCRGTLLAKDGQPIDIVYADGMGDAAVVYAIRQGDGASEVEFLEKWTVLERGSDFIKAEVVESCVYQPGDILLICQTGENADNEQLRNITEIIGHIYSEDELTEIWMFKGSLSELNQKYPVECLRETDTMKTVVYLSDHSIVFMDFKPNGDPWGAGKYGREHSSAEFMSLRIGDTLEEVWEFDPDGSYPFLYSGAKLPPFSKHYTTDGYTVEITYDEGYRITSIDIQLISGQRSR